MSQPERWFFVSDMDDTLLGDDSGLVELTAALQAASQDLIVAYNSSRPCASLRKTLGATPRLPIPDYLIGALGTEIEEGKSGLRLAEYSERLSRDWNHDCICALIDPMGFIAHPPEFQTAQKISYTVPDAASYAEVVRKLRAAGLKAKVIFSGGNYLDIIPTGAGKGSAINYLCDYLKIDPERVVVAGDSGNDVDMFVAPFKGIVVGNADPALRERRGDHIYQASSTHARGVLEGLRFWRVL